MAAERQRGSVAVVMRIRVYSDLHLEFDPFEPPASEDVDVVIRATST
ncbi:MAG: hypothetical protein INH41_17115 [Myxococcaceae bacterium]|jgi:hypothetical protein|nr:hypothetical protein [Myxococcaceae bacterium]MCA3014104.1 hypothetical protein [Myxococcaceae bacterium]